MDLDKKISYSTIKKLSSSHKIIAICNSIAPINCFMYIPFSSIWTDNAPENPLEQHRQRRFKQDIHFEDQLPMLAPAAFWVMTQYYPIYKKEGLKPPSIVVEYGKDYLNDPVSKFISEHNVSDPLTYKELYPQFVEWYRRTYPDQLTLNRNVFKVQLLEKL